MNKCIIVKIIYDIVQTVVYHKVHFVRQKNQGKYCPKPIKEMSLLAGVFSLLKHILRVAEIAEFIISPANMITRRHINM